MEEGSRITSAPTIFVSLANVCLICRSYENYFHKIAWNHEYTSVIPNVNAISSDRPLARYTRYSGFHPFLKVMSFDAEYEWNRSKPHIPYIMIFDPLVDAFLIYPIQFSHFGWVYITYFISCKVDITIHTYIKWK